MEDRHSTWYEQALFAASVATKTLCAVAVFYVFFGATFVPGCDIGAMTSTRPVMAYMPLSLLAIATAYFSAYGSNWTPVSWKYECIDLFFALVFAIPLLVGVIKNLGAMTDAMQFTAYLFGVLVGFGILLDWIGRLVRWNILRKAAAP